MNLPTYTTVDEANDILGLVSPWAGATDDFKLDALQSAKIYSDQNYNKYFVDADGIPENVKIGNALLANEHLKQDLFTRQTNLGALEEKTIKAGSVTTTKKYKNNSGNSWVDPFTKITGIMKPSFILKSKGGVKTFALVRG